MADTINDAMRDVDTALDGLVAVYHQREIRAFHACHDDEGHAWAGHVDELQNMRDLIHRMPFAAHFTGKDSS